MKYIGYHHEDPPTNLEKLLSSYNHYDHKVNVWNTFVDSNLPDITHDDFSIIPRILPMSYWPTLRRSVYLTTLFVLRLLSLPEREIRAIIPRGPIRDHLLDELQVLRFHRKRMTGTFRYDMAIEGPPDRHHPPQLLEINEIGYDGAARTSYFQKTLLNLMPELRKRCVSLDAAESEIRNMKRLGSRIARIQYADYNWDDLLLYQMANRMKLEMRLVSPAQFKVRLDEDCPLLEKLPIKVIRGRSYVGDWRPDALNVSFAHELRDYRKGLPLYRNLVRSQTPQYGPFVTGLVATKTILILLDDPHLRKKLLGSANALASSILPAHLLSDPKAEKLLHEPRKWVLKHTDGCGGEQVFMNRELERQLKRIPAHRRYEWVLQQKMKLNLIDVNGMRSRPKRAISDLAVFVQYDWSGDRFLHFEIGGLMTRATNRSLKVNVSGGGLLVAVFLDRSR